MKPNMPGVFTVKLNAVASTVPLAPRAIGPDVAAGAPVQVPFVNQSMVTFPVGIGFSGLPVTVTKWCAVAPAATVVTVACAALWMSVAVVEPSFWIVVCDPAVVVWLPTGQLGAPLEHVSCQVRTAWSVRMWAAF